MAAYFIYNNINEIKNKSEQNDWELRRDGLIHWNIIGGVIRSRNSIVGENYLFTFINL